MEIPVSSNPKVQADYEMFEKGYNACINDVLTALTDYLANGGKINMSNVASWFKKFDEGDK